MILHLGDRKGRSPVVNTIDNQGNPVGAGFKPAPTSTYLPLQQWELLDYGIVD